MLSMGKVVEIERLLAEGRLSQRKISRLVGVSRGVISAIAHGTRPDYTARRLAPSEGDSPRGDIQRCPTCGGRVYMPCRLCRVRQMKEHESALLPKLQRRSRQQGIRRLLVAVLRAAAASQTAGRQASQEIQQTAIDPN